MISISSSLFINNKGKFATDIYLLDEPILIGLNLTNSIFLRDYDDFAVYSDILNHEASNFNNPSMIKIISTGKVLIINCSVSNAHYAL